MLNLFKSKLKKSWGLQITERHLRLVEINGERKNWRIGRMGKIDLPVGTVDNGLVKKPDVFKEAVHRLRRTSFPNASKSPLAVVNLAEEHAFFRVIQIPPLDKNEISEAIQWEAESNIPLPIDKVYLAWELLGKNPDQNLLAGSKQDNKSSVLLAATPKDIIDNLLNTLGKCGIMPIAIESDSTALIRSLAQTQSFPSPETPLMIVNLREHYTHIIIFDSQVVILSATSENASEDFDKIIEDTFKIKWEEAEKFRQKVGWSPENPLGQKLVEATAVPFNALKKDIGGAISFFNNKNGKTIAEIILTGEKRSKWNGFDKYLEKEIGIPTKWQGDWNPNIWPSKCPYITAEKEEYNVGIGLALRKLEEEL